ncbi:MAG: hypothetical protein P8H96_04325, partial [Akkermansiaceae bacterium]|nr:hypothetical protein [Akkermansiaceae bacterium]
TSRRCFIARVALLIGRFGRLNWIGIHSHIFAVFSANPSPPSSTHRLHWSMGENPPPKLRKSQLEIGNTPLGIDHNRRNIIHNRLFGQTDT